jgi:SAM-dependent methyltransferase
VTSWPYDLTAAFYDEDMGRNTDGRDVAWYRAQASEGVASLGGRILELGAGTGRITLPLAADGRVILALDRSQPMLEELRRKAQVAGLAGHIQTIAMDMGQAGLAGRFASVLCPYSAFCYLVENAERDGLLSAVRAWLPPGGKFLLDAFVPDQGLANLSPQVEIQDYDRPLPPDAWGDAVRLARSKRVELEAMPGVNRIRRRYRFLKADGTVLREVETESLQRAYMPASLAALLRSAGFASVTVCGDFDAATPATPPARRAAFVARV